MADAELDLTSLVTAVRGVHERCAAQASRAVNINLTLRNWLIGAYLHEYELRGADRARYGDGLFSELADQLSKANVSNCGKRQLYRYARFYKLYRRLWVRCPHNWPASPHPAWRKWVQRPHY